MGTCLTPVGKTHSLCSWAYIPIPTKVEVLYEGRIDARGDGGVGDNSGPLVMCVAALGCSATEQQRTIYLLPAVGHGGADRLRGQ